MVEETKAEISAGISEDKDVFFDLYGINIACYYNSKTILKLLNETTNISRNVNEVLQTYEENSNRIKEFDNKTYNVHIISIKKVLSRLFQKKKKKESFFKNFHNVIGDFSSWSSEAGDQLKSYIEDMEFPNIEKISSYIPIPTEQKIDKTLGQVEKGIRTGMDKTVETVGTVGQGMYETVGTVGTFGKDMYEKRERKLERKANFNKFVDDISKEIFSE